MGIFEGFKNTEFYETIKERLWEILANPTLDETVAAELEKPSNVEITSGEQKAVLKSIKKVLEQMPAQVNLHALDFTAKQLSPEAVLALIRAITSRNERNDLNWPISTLSLSGTQFMLFNKNNAKSSKKLPDTNSQAIETAIMTEFCAYLGSTRTLTTLDLSNNNLGNEFISKLLLKGIRNNSSIKTIYLRNADLDGGTTIPDALVEILMKAPDTVRLGSIVRKDPRIALCNMSLRSIDVSANPWNKEAVEKLAGLVNICVRIKDLKISDGLKKITYQGKNLDDILKRNTAVTDVMDDVLFNVLNKRSFKEKLQTFKASIKENRIKGKSNNTLGPVGDSVPVYKLIAAQNEEGGRFDPFHPTLFPSDRWKAGYATSIGRREEMQDIVALRGKFRETISPVDSTTIQNEDWWAVYDGHGGREAAVYAAENLHQIIATNLDKLPTPSPADRAEAIKSAFKQCQKEMAPWNVNVGTTAVGIYIHDNLRYTVNLGDSRALLFNSKDEVPLILTKDHRPVDGNEKKRIMRIPGAFIEDGKINGKLSVSRALGDSSLSPIVSCLPDVEWAEIRPDDEFIIIASDGLWDVFAGEGSNPVERGSIIHPANLARFMNGCREVIDIVMKSSSAPSAAKKLCEYAFKNGSADNISVIVVFLNRKAGKTEKVKAERPTSVAKTVVNAAAVNTLSRTIEPSQIKAVVKSTSNTSLFAESKEVDTSAPVPAAKEEKPIPAPEVKTNSADRNVKPKESVETISPSVKSDSADRKTQPKESVETISSTKTNSADRKAKVKESAENISSVKSSSVDASSPKATSRQEAKDHSTMPQPSMASLGRSEKSRDSKSSKQDSLDYKPFKLTERDKRATSIMISPSHDILTQLSAAISPTKKSIADAFVDEMIQYMNSIK